MNASPFLSVIVCLFTMGVSPAQTKDAAVILQLDSTTQGVLFPRMTTAQRDAIASPPNGLTVYNTTTNGLNVYTGTEWVSAGGTENVTSDEITNGTSTTPRLFSPADIKAMIDAHATSSVVPQLTNSNITHVVAGNNNVTFALTGSGFQPGQQFDNLPNTYTQQVTINSPSSAQVVVTGTNTTAAALSLNFANHLSWANAPTLSLSQQVTIDLLGSISVSTGNYYQIVSNSPFGSDTVTGYKGNNYVNSVYRAVSSGTVHATDIKESSSLFEKPSFTALDYPQNTPFSYVLTNAGNTAYNNGPTLAQLNSAYASQEFYDSNDLSMPYGQGLQVLTIRKAGNYRITAWGATGTDVKGNVTGTTHRLGGSNPQRGSAAKVSNVFTLAANTQIVVAVGQHGYKVGDTGDSADGGSGVVGGNTYVAIVAPGSSFSMSNSVSLLAGGGPAQGDADYGTRQGYATSHSYYSYGSSSSLTSSSQYFPSSVSSLAGTYYNRSTEHGYAGWASSGSDGAVDDLERPSTSYSYNGGGSNATFSNSTVSADNPNTYSFHHGAVLIEEVQN